MAMKHDDDFVRGIRLVQLDYETGVYIDEYSSVRAFAQDYDIDLKNLYRHIHREDSLFIRLKKHKLLLMKKSKYVAFKKVIDEGLF
ncbi:hypothetical protein [Zhenhengia yiwuensis]|uniref:Uncharacterized protein n=1 Tax=Zhenhengia yiwuensis TaxID=2763666 RepID=A0A926EIF6_9FIRM|nr:hypothetical protein [Zhenhengia yiwuensis]MBC8579150.1 hypothetical protein [Zhenhengia yiwuensis]